MLARAALALAATEIKYISCALLRRQSRTVWYVVAKFEGKSRGSPSGSLGELQEHKIKRHRPRQYAPFSNSRLALILGCPQLG